MKNQSIKKNYVYNTAYQILALITPLITAPYISRVLGADGVGVYSYTSAMVAFFTLFARLGTATYGQRVIAQNRDDEGQRSKLFWEIELLSVITTLIVLVLWIIFLAVYPQYTLYFFILSLDLISNAFDITWFYNGLERFSYIVFRNSAVKIIGVVLIFILVKTKNDLWIYILILAGTKLLGNISMWMALPKLVSKVKFKSLRIFSHFKETIVYFIPALAASAYTYIDKIMLGLFTTTSEENGYYEQAEKIIKVGYTIVISINTVMSSRLSYLFAQGDKNEISKRLEQGLAFICTLGIPITFGIAAVSRNFVPWFFGNGFEKVITLMIIGSPLVVIQSLHNYLLSQYLIPSGQRGRSTKGVLIGSGVNFVLNLILIPTFQSIGALIATVISESVIFIIYYYMSKDFVPGKLYLKYLPKQILSAVIMTIVVLLIGRGRSGSIIITILQVLVGAIIYMVMLLILKEEFTMSSVKQVLERINVFKKK